MNIFVLNTGRCGSTTFIKACEHLNNYTTGHETRSTLVGSRRLSYPQNHVEADNRLSWFLGRLEQTYGDNAFYVHLSRDREKTINSFVKRMDFGIMKAYREGILLDGESSQTDHDIAADYIDTIEANINLFLQNKSRKIEFKLENAKQDFIVFWEKIGAEGNLDRALRQWDIQHNASI